MANGLIQRQRLVGRSHPSGFQGHRGWTSWSADFASGRPRRDRLLGGGVAILVSMAAGRCLCGAVRFEVGGELTQIELCHCVKCKKAYGAAFAATLYVRSENFPSIFGVVRPSMPRSRM